jgi:hypothetical protein
LYIFAIRSTSWALLNLWPDASVPRRVARIVWLSAALGACLAALLYRGPGLDDLRDANLEIGVASVPLLFIPARGRAVPGADPIALVRGPLIIALSVGIFVVFAATMGRGIGALA